MARAQGARAQMALAFETTYGVPPAGGFVRMPFASTSLGAEQPLLTSELLGHGRDPLAPIKDAVTVDGDVVVPLDAEAFGFWLRAAFGEPITSGAGPWTHEFRSGSWTLPSLSIETGMPEVPRYAMYSGCVLDQLSWQMQRSGLLTATARLVAQGETVGTASAAGTPAALELKRFGHFNGAITRNGAALGDVVSAEITYANNLDRIETIRADGRIDGADPSIAALTGRIEVRFADQTLVTQAVDGDPCELEFGYVLPSGESFTFTVHAVHLPRPRIEISGPQGVQASFDWQAARDAAVGRMCTARLVNQRASFDVVAAVAPSAFAAGDWSLADQPSAGGDRLTLTVAGLPATGGTAITALQWRVGGGAPATLGGTTAGAYEITVLAGAEASVEIRAVNAVGPGPWSAAKTATPTATAAGPALTLAPVWKRHLSDASSSFYARADAAGTLYLASLETPPASGAALEAAAAWSGAVAAGADAELTATGLVGPISTVYVVVKSSGGAHGPVVAIPRNSNVGKFVTDLPSGLVGGVGGISGNLRLGSGGAFRWSVFAAPKPMIPAQEIIDAAGSPLAAGTDPIVTANVTQPFAVTGLAPGDHVLFVTSLSGTGVIGETWRVPFTAT